MSVYTGERVRRGLLHFLLGKGISSVAGLLGMILVVRGLAVAEFAAYSVLVALVEVVTALTSLGLSHVVLRYVPELYVSREIKALGGLIVRAFVARMAVLAVLVLLAASNAPLFAELLGIDEWVYAVQLFMLLLIPRVAGHFLSQCLESTLHQSIAQTAFSVGAIVRAGVIMTLLANGKISLVNVIWAEIAGDVICALILIGGMAMVLSDRHGQLPGNWVNGRWRRLGRFALSGYLQHLAILPYGGHTNRLIGGHMLSTGAMAVYGFAQSLYEYAKRYLPAQMLVGLIRPVVIARYSGTHDFAVAARLCQRVLQINLLLVGALLVPLLIAGPELLLAMSAHKYGDEAAMVLLGLTLVLVLETQRQQLELLCQTVERYDLLLPTNLLLSASVLLAALLLVPLGPVAFPLGNALGLIVANSRVLRALRKLGHRFRHDWLATLGTVVMVLVSSGLGLLVSGLSQHWMLGLLAGELLFLALVARLRVEVMRGFYRDLTRGKSQVLPAFPVSAEPLLGAPTKIAFGVLSCRAESAAMVSQIARLVHPHPVIVHHDFSQYPDFQVSEPNVRVLPEPVATGSGNWSLVEASCLLMEEALKDESVTHFQLLSEACLPVQPIADFERYLQDHPATVAMIDVIKLDTYETFFSHGGRYLPGGRWVRRIARRLAICAWGSERRHRQVANVNLRLIDTRRPPRLRQILGTAGLKPLRWWTRQRIRQLGIGHIAIGTPWFGLSRSGLAWLLACTRECPQLIAYFKQSHIPDEAFFQTLISNGAERWPALHCGPGNHALIREGEGSGPDALDMPGVEKALDAKRFFARKCSPDFSPATRRRVIDRTDQAQ